MSLANPQDIRDEAAQLYAEARKLEARRDYVGALRKCERSLQLYNDPEVEAAYFRLRATTGPK